MTLSVDNADMIFYFCNNKNQPHFALSVSVSTPTHGSLSVTDALALLGCRIVGCLIFISFFWLCAFAVIVIFRGGVHFNRTNKILAEIRSQSSLWNQICQLSQVTILWLYSVVHSDYIHFIGPWGRFSELKYSKRTRHVCEIYFLHIWNQNSSQYAFHSLPGKSSILRLCHNHTQVLPTLSYIQLFIIRKYYPTHKAETMTKEAKLYQMCILDMDTNRWWHVKVMSTYQVSAVARCLIQPWAWQYVGYLCSLRSQASPFILHLCQCSLLFKPKNESACKC